MSWSRDCPPKPYLRYRRNMVSISALTLAHIDLVIGVTGSDDFLFQFGEPLGSHRKRDRFGLTCCHSKTRQMTGMSYMALECEEMIHHDHHQDAGTVLDISFRKQQQVLEDLYRRVLIQNITKTVQQEIKKTILQSIF